MISLIDFFIDLPEPISTLIQTYNLARGVFVVAVVAVHVLTVLLAVWAVCEIASLVALFLCRIGVLDDAQYQNFKPQIIKTRKYCLWGTVGLISLGFVIFIWTSWMMKNFIAPI